MYALYIPPSTAWEPRAVAWAGPCPACPAPLAPCGAPGLAGECGGRRAASLAWARASASRLLWPLCVRGTRLTPAAPPGTGARGPFSLETEPLALPPSADLPREPLPGAQASLAGLGLASRPGSRCWGPAIEQRGPRVPVGSPRPAGCGRAMAVRNRGESLLPRSISRSVMKVFGNCRDCCN